MAGFIETRVQNLCQAFGDRIRVSGHPKSLRQFTDIISRIERARDFIRLIGQGRKIAISAGDIYPPSNRDPKIGADEQVRREIAADDQRRSSRAA